MFLNLIHFPHPFHFPPFPFLAHLLSLLTPRKMERKEISYARGRRPQARSFISGKPPRLCHEGLASTMHIQNTARSRIPSHNRFLLSSYFCHNAPTRYITLTFFTFVKFSKFSGYSMSFYSLFMSKTISMISPIRSTSSKGSLSGSQRCNHEGSTDDPRKELPSRPCRGMPNFLSRVAEKRSRGQIGCFTVDGEHGNADRRDQDLIFEIKKSRLIDSACF